MGRLTISTEEAPGAIIIKLAGEANVEEVDELERQLERLATVRVPLFVMDLSGLAFAASLAMSTLLRFRSQLKSEGRALALADLRPMVCHAFKHAQLHRVFTISPTVEEALSATPVPG